VRLGVTPEINAICTILIAVVALGVVAASLLTKRSQMKQEGMVAIGAVR
jgi:putrescine transport system permease protein